MKLKHTILAIASAVAMVSATNVMADSVESQFFQGELNQASDNSADFLVNSDGSFAFAADPSNLMTSIDAGTGTIVDVGDTLTGIFDINTIEDLTGGGGTNSLGLASGNNEWSGMFAINVETKTLNDANGNGTFDDGETYTFTFSPDATFEAKFGTGAMIAMFEDATEYTRLNDTAVNLFNNILDGTLRLVLGFDGDVDQLWTATAVSDDIGVIGAVAPPGNGGTVNFQLNVLQNLFANTTFGLVDTTVVDGFGDNKVNFNGSGNLLGTAGANTPFDAFDNFDVVFRTVPEPGSVLLLGMGLLSLLGFRKKTAALKA